MSRSKIMLVAIATMMVISSFAFIMNTTETDAAPGDQWDGFIEDQGTKTFGSDWIPISNIDELQNITAGSDKKYYLTNNIDLTDYSLQDSFDIKITVVRNTNDLLVTLSIVDSNDNVFPMYVEDGAKIFVNEEVGTLSPGETKASFTVAIDDSINDLQIFAVGKATNVDSSYDEGFIISTSCNGDVVTPSVVNSKGNFTPLTFNTGSIILDGNGYVIKGLRTIDYSSNGNAYSGLFGNVGGSISIRNLSLVDGSSISFSSASSGKSYSAGLIGYAYSTTITNSYNTGTITATASSSSSSSSSHAHAGGLIGQASSSTTITNSYNTGNVTAIASSSSSSSSSSLSHARAGGLIGQASSSSTTTTITNSYNTGNVTAIASSSSPLISSSYAHAGGLIGHAQSTTTITNSYNTGDITASSSSSTYVYVYVGGLIGRAESTTITNSYNTGDIISPSYAGGLIGQANSNLLITSSYMLENTTTNNRLVGNKDNIDFSGSGPRTEKLMKAETTFVNWNFDTLWTTNGDTAYPTLVPTGRWDGFIVNEGNDYDPTNGETGWVAVSSAEQLQNMVSGGKYYLTNDIDLRYTNSPDAFEITVEASIDNTGKITIKLKDGTNTLSVTDLVISINGKIEAVSNTTAEFTIDTVPPELQITAGGTVTNPPPGKDGTFAISTVLDIPTIVGTPTTTKLQSKGNFIPIGSSASPFNGTIDGNGYSIMGLRTTAYSSSSNSYSSLISYAGDLTIKNLGIKDGESVAVSSFANAGGLIGRAESTTTITNSYNTGIITASSANAGGLIGRAESTTTITNSYNTGIITASSFADAGGLIGHASSTTTITNSYNTGIITASSANAGGLIGCAESTTEITNSYNTGIITVTASSYAYAGGLIGNAQSVTTITNSYNTGNVTATTSSSLYGAYGGGLIGHATSTTITNSYNTGIITASSSSYAYAGGLIGYAFLKAFISSSYAIDGSATKLVGAGAIVTKDSYSMIKPIADMKKQATFIDWNFNSIWMIEEGQGYPILRDSLQRWENFIVNEGEDYIPEGMDESWIELNNSNFMAVMQNSPALDGKYYLSENIDLTGVSALDSFPILLEASLSGTDVTITLKDGATDLAFTDGLISVNGNIKAYDESWSFAESSLSDDLHITIGGTISNPPTNMDFFIVISTIISKPVDAANSVSVILQSKGNFIPIGSLASPFKGTIDGNGYSIIGLRTTAYSTSSNVYSGLIAYSNGMTIKNLGLEGGSSVAVSSSSSDAYAGGLIGYASSTTITNSYNTGDIFASSSLPLSYAYAGGLIGYASSSSSTITNSYNTGNVTASSSYKAYAGGLIGREDSTTTITNSYNTGGISASSPHEAYAGGLIGYAGSTTTITNSYNTGDISASSPSSSDAYAGGLIGYASSSSTITNSYNTGTITASLSTAYAGGLVGYAWSNLSIFGSYAINTQSLTLCGECYETPTTTGSGMRLDTEMKDQNTFKDKDGNSWDFVNIWKIDNTGVINNGYPYHSITNVPVVPNEVTVTTTSETEGSIKIFVGSDTTPTPSPATVSVGSDVTIEIVVNDGYELMMFSVNGVDKKSELLDNKYEITNISSDQDIQVYFRPIMYMVEPTVTQDSGSIVPGAAGIRAETGSFDFTVEPNTGYRITGNTPTSLKADRNDLVFTVSEVIDSTATLSIDMSDLYKVEAEISGDTGTSTILPASYDNVKYQSGKAEFNLTIEEGYEIEDIIFDESKMNVSFEDNIVTVNGVLEDCKLTVKMKKMTYDVTITSTSGGKTSPSGTQKVIHGESLSVSISPDNGYKILDVKVNGSSNSNAISSGKLNLSNITSNMSVNVSFAKDTAEVFYLNVYAGEGGNAYGSGYYEKGSQASIYALAKDGYKFKEWSNGSTSATSSVMVTDNMDIQAIFEKSSAWSGGSSSIGNDDIAIVIGVIIAIFGITAILGWAFTRKKG